MVKARAKDSRSVDGVVKNTTVSMEGFLGHDFLRGSKLEILRGFLSFPVGSTKEIFDQFKTIKGHIFREQNANRKERFLYVEGKRKNKVLLVAHADTFLDNSDDVCNFVRVGKGQFIRGVDENGKSVLMGADDRVGVAMLWLLRESGHSILLVDGEEYGLRGSSWLANDNKDILDRINRRHQFVINLDLRGGRRFKCYNVGSKKFKQFIEERTGYLESDKNPAAADICAICKTICGANFSVGYYNEHEVIEILNVRAWLHTFNTISELISDPALPKFELKPSTRDNLRKIAKALKI
jgi:hypothetical protein